MWIADGKEGAPVRQLATNEAKKGVRVFDGRFTCCYLKHEGMEMCDKEKIVEPILGLFGAAYRQREDRAEIFEMLDQPDMFPATYIFEQKLENGKVVKQVAVAHINAHPSILCCACLVPLIC
jgi:hypothetical protein